LSKCSRPTFRVGRFTGTIWQRWSEELFSLVVMYATRFGSFVCAERNRIGGARTKGVDKSRGRPCGGKFMRRRRSWKHVAHGQFPGRSRTAYELVRGPDVHDTRRYDFPIRWVPEFQVHASSDKPYLQHRAAPRRSFDPHRDGIRTVFRMA